MNNENAADGNDERKFEQLDKYLAPAADEMADEIGRLRDQLMELDLISEEDPGELHLNVLGGVYGIEITHPDGPWLCTRDGEDSIVATRWREDHYEHALLDEHGVPIEWRRVIRPKGKG
jgi:hypothetical protein